MNQFRQQIRALINLIKEYRESERQDRKLGHVRSASEWEFEVSAFRGQVENIARILEVFVYPEQNETVISVTELRELERDQLILHEILGRDAVSGQDYADAVKAIDNFLENN